MSLERCRIVFVRPQFAGNVGATARIMRNMGMVELVLVAPEADLADPQARKLSTRGEPILDQARIVAELDEAVADCPLVVGTSARTGGPYRRQSVGAPDEVAALMADALASGPAALVFGPESSGLRDAEVTRCHHLIRIPSDPSYPALNLAQAAAICTYEVRRAWLRRTEPVPPVCAAAPFDEQERMFDHLRAALEEIHFLYGPSAGPLMHALRHLIGRARPTPMEVDLLHGLARQIHWFARNRPRDARGEPWPSP